MITPGPPPANGFNARHCEIFEQWLGLPLIEAGAGTDSLSRV